MKFFILLLLLLSHLQAQLVEYDIKPESMKSKRFMDINILDSKELRFDDIKLSELSALAYNNNKLYAVSDLGYLCSFDIAISKNKIETLEFIHVNGLKNKQGKRLKKIRRDSEGMVLIDNQLYISFEREPRVDVFSLNGQKIKNYKITKKLRDIDNYQSKNKALESIAYSKHYGVLTAPELPLVGESSNLHVIYANDKQYRFSATSSLTAMEFIDDDKLLTIERNFNKSTHQTVILLKKVFLDRCDAGVCKSEILALLESERGWQLDNFEGLAKVGKNRFLMISDNNGSLLQKTLLVLFEVVTD